VRIAFTIDCCDREAISWAATTGSIDSGGIRDLMIESVERRFGAGESIAGADRIATPALTRAQPWTNRKNHSLFAYQGQLYTHR
jgi:hypothetical protein